MHHEINTTTATSIHDDADKENAGLQEIIAKQIKKINNGEKRRALSEVTDPAAAASDLSDYEKMRLEKIRRNMEMLRSLGINEAKQKVATPISASPSSASSERKVISQRIVVTKRRSFENLGKRESKRIRGEAVEFIDLDTVRKQQKLAAKNNNNNSDNDDNDVVNNSTDSIDYKSDNDNDNNNNHGVKVTATATAHNDNVLKNICGWDKPLQLPVKIRYTGPVKNPSPTEPVVYAELRRVDMPGNKASLVILTGRHKDPNKIYNPTGAANLIGGGSKNGWDFFTYNVKPEGEEPMWVPISYFRESFVLNQRVAKGPGFINPPQ